MKALIRNKGETILETTSLEGIDWNTGYPLTNAKWFGGPYTLVQNYVPHMEDDESPQYEEVIVEDPEPIPQDEEKNDEDVVEDDDYVVIGGVRYSKAELRSLIE